MIDRNRLSWLTRSISTAGASHESYPEHTVQMIGRDTLDELNWNDGLGVALEANLNVARLDVAQAFDTGGH